MRQRKCKDLRRDMRMFGRGWLSCVNTINTQSFKKRLHIAMAVILGNLDAWL